MHKAARMMSVSTLQQTEVRKITKKSMLDAARVTISFGSASFSFIIGNALTGECDVAVLTTGVWNATTSPTYTNAGETFTVSETSSPLNACPDVQSKASLHNYELETITLKCLDKSTPADGYLE
jgi:hypothetical protein